MDNECLLRLLDGKTETIWVMLLMTLWRIWHCHNKVIHQKPAHWELQAPLCSYLESVLSIKQFPNADPTKGKIMVS
jgi:hypothetical protein